MTSYPLFDIGLDKLPTEITISTMTIVCKINITFNVTDISRYIDLKHDGIITIKHGSDNDVQTNRSLITKKNLAIENDRKKKKKKKSFYNQVTLSIKSDLNKITNIKLFKNGSIQMTGCKSKDGVVEVLEKLFSELRIVKAIYDPEQQKIIEKPFISDPEMLKISNLYNVQICMINSNFSIGFNIDRDKLYEILLRDKLDCSFDPIIHACVNIKYEHREKMISIFVFESGAIIITGACTCQQINAAYEFINRYLLSNYNYIHKNNMLINLTILRFLNSIKDTDNDAKNCKANTS